ncbi:hypothetical protein K501DRAFT_146222, partial [Backusella circina FSU 941]
MSFDIPGYYFDKKKNKLFKLNPTGPYSLSEIRKRLKAEQEEEAAAAKKQKRPQKPIPNIHQFIHQRTLFGRNVHTHTTHPGMISLASRLKQKQTLRLDGPKETHQSIKVDMDKSEFIMANKKGIGRYGYRCRPRFQVWASGFISDESNVTSLYYKQKHLLVNGTSNHPSRGGTFFEYRIQPQPPLTPEEAHTFSTIRNNDTILGIPNSHIDNIHSVPLYEYRIKRDTFWTSYFDPFQGTTVVGGERKLHIIHHDHAHSRRSMHSDVFALYTTPAQTCWVGLRNGTLGAMDLRTNDKFHFKLKGTSSITQVRCLENGGNEVLVVGMDGTVSIYDRRKPQKHPVRRLIGHHNETHQHLGMDIDETNHLLMLAGDDGYVRIWSLFRTKQDPIFTSRRYSRPVPGVCFM